MCHSRAVYGSYTPAPRRLFDIIICYIITSSRRFLCKGDAALHNHRKMSINHSMAAPQKGEILPVLARLMEERTNLDTGIPACRNPCKIRTNGERIT